jgi:hypothetical protein
MTGGQGAESVGVLAEAVPAEAAPAATAVKVKVEAVLGETGVSVPASAEETVAAPIADVTAASRALPRSTWKN